MMPWQKKACWALQCPVLVFHIHAFTQNLGESREMGMVDPSKKEIIGQRLKPLQVLF